MPLPIFLFAVWALWPFAAYPGGKLFAPLVVLIGLFAIPSMLSSKLRLPVIVGLVLLSWVCLSTIWSPANEGLFSGSLLEENFALDASYLRFVLTIIGCFLFVKLVAEAPDAKLRAVPKWIYAGLLIQFLAVAATAVLREHLLLSQGDFLVPTGQSMGRNVNFLAMGAPLLLGGLALRGKPLQGRFAGAVLLALMVALALKHNGLAVIFALVLGTVAFAVLRFGTRAGFRVLFNVAAFGVVTAPALALGLGALPPAFVSALPLSAQHRFVIWQATLERIFEQPFFGHGVGATTTWTDTYASRPELLEKLVPEFVNNRILPNHSHNMAIQIWSETGLVGALLMGLLLVLVGRALPAPRELSTAVKISTAGLFGAALTYFSFSYSVWDDSYWAGIAIVLSGVIVLHRKASS